MDKCTCKITPGTSAYGGNQIDSRGCEKHDTRDEIIEQLRQERDNALRYTELLIAERDAARAGEARAVEACQRIEEALQGTDFADHGLDSPVWNALELVRDVTADKPALAWLAQQRREAVATELERVAGECHDFWSLFALRDWLRDRAAALLGGAEALERMEAMESTGFIMSPKSTSVSEEGK